MIQDIDKHLDIIKDAIQWAHDYGKDAFPINVLKEHRRRLRLIRQAMEENCSAAAYGESQVGKSYLMSSLLSSSSAPFVIENGGKTYSFIDELNPSGGNNSKVESTGVITRFTLNRQNPAMSQYVRVQLLSVVDIILLITDSYYNDIKLQPESMKSTEEINRALEQMAPMWDGKATLQSIITEDDVWDMRDYVNDVIGNNATSVYKSRFWSVVAPIIHSVPHDQWVSVFSLLWNRNEEMSRLFGTLISEYSKLGFCKDIYVPFSAMLREKGTLLKIEWLDSVCGVTLDTGKDEIYTDIYDPNGRLIAQNFPKGSLSALIAELTFELPDALAEERPFLRKMDLLDFPGARSREKFKEADIHTVLPKMLRRGKVAYLFNKYSRSLRISSVLFCHHNDQKAEPTLGGTIDTWVEKNIGPTPKERAAMLANTGGIAPLFIVATKFNIDLERTKTDTPDNLGKLDEHWNRFDTVIPEIIKPSTWMDDWVPQGGMFTSSAFQNVYPLRDYYWSGKNRVFVGYQDGAVKHAETDVYRHADFPDYMDRLRDSFLRNAFVRKHFANPERTWDDVATINHDGSRAIMRNLDGIAEYLDDARRQKYLTEVRDIKQQMYKALAAYFQPEDIEEKNKKVRQVSGDITRELMFAFGSRPEVFGRILDGLMLPADELRNIAYDILICHTQTPVDFSVVEVIRAMVGINVSDPREENVQRLCDFFCCDVSMLEEDLKNRGCTLEDVVSNNSSNLGTEADVVAKNIVDHWVDHLNEQAHLLKDVLPRTDEMVFMLVSLMKKVGIERVLADKINTYSQMFNSNELLNAIADFASLTLNNFVSTVGRDYIPDQHIATIQEKAQLCQIPLGMNADNLRTAPKPRPLEDALRAFDNQNSIINQDAIDMTVLRQLPLWDNFQRWMTLVRMGLVYTSDVSKCDPVENERIKRLMDACDTLYI